MRCIELFAGAGGAALGLERAGFTHAALVERDRDACATLRAAGLGPVVEGDVRDLAAIEAVAGRDCDLLWSSFPCQAWSHAGKRLGVEDDRNGWPWTVDAIDHFRPTWFLAENVRGLLSTDYFDDTIMAQLGERFRHVGHWLLDAADFGVPQHRRRVFIWAGPSPLVPPTRTHGPGMFTRPWVTMGDALDLRSDEVLHHMRNTEAHPTQERPTPSTEPSPTIGGKGNQFIDRPAPTVTTTEVKGTRASAKSGGTFNGGPDLASDALYMATGRRRLTVEECATLQGFPADHPWQGTKTSRYRQVGNAVPPALAYAVGCQVVENAHHADAFINRRECP
jgi:DNA (cytosine-5)-methyltransferase 1